MAEIYRAFGPDDIVSDIQTVSQPLWSENINPLSSASSAAGLGFYTSSNQAGKDYYINVYHRNPNIAASTSSAVVQYAVAYGNRLGSGSYGDPNVVSSNNTNDTPSRAIYSQYRNMLLDPNTQQFTFGPTGYTTGSDEIIAINIARSRFKQKVDPGNWTLKMGSGSGWFSAAGNPSMSVTFTDDSGQSTTVAPTVGKAGRVFNIVSGSDGTPSTADSTYYGAFYPDAGLLIFHAGLLRSRLGLPINSGSATTLAAALTQPRNHITASMAISASGYFSARSEEKVSSTHYFVRVTNKQFNFSNNPTFVSGSDGTFAIPSMLRNPSVYITTIGLYDDSNRLVAVAKLSKPLLKSFNREALIKVKLDY